MERLRKAIDACTDWNEPSDDDEKRLVAELAAVEARLGRLSEHVKALNDYLARHGDEDEGDGRRWKRVLAARAAITEGDLL